MIYNNTHFNEQLKKTYIEGKKGELTLLFCVVTIALVTLITHNFFHTLNETIIAKVFPHLIKYSIFSMLSVYNFVIILFFISLCMIKYKRITIAEISTNKWYLLVKTGHSPIKLVFSKLMANILSAVFIYSLAYILLILLGTLMGLSMDINAIFSLAVLGLIQLFFVVELIMAISIFVQNRGNCLLIVILGIAFMFFIAQITGFYAVSTSVIKMEDTSNLFTEKSSIYIYALLLMAFAMLFLGLIKGYMLSIHYKPKAKLGENVYSINYLNDNTKFVPYYSELKPTLFKTLSKIALGIVIVCSIMSNMGIIMLATLSQPDSGIGNHIMMTFESQTMTGEIEKNDFVCFEKMTSSDRFEVGDVIVYYKNKNAVVQIIDEISSDGSYWVDYLDYPNGVKEGSYRKNISNSEISGKLVFKSSWLGAYIIWNKSIVSKIITTVLPTLLLIFYDKLEGMYLFIKSTAGTDEEDSDVSVNG